MTKKIALAGASMVLALHAGVYNVTPDVGEDRVESPLSVPMKRIGTLKPKSVNEINDSNWTLGCEVLDRDFADFEAYKELIAPLGVKTIRLQGGWAKCERVKGRYDFAWLDRIIDYARRRGIEILLETGYGNPIYKGGGTPDIAGGFPVSEEALSAWDAWVDALSRHFAGRVRDWAMWNEPDLHIDSPPKTIEEIAAFNVRTAKIIKRNIPQARIGGLSLMREDPVYFESCLKAIGGDIGLFEWFIYHGYTVAPESAYANVERLKAILAKYSPNARMRQGENGCPSEMGLFFGLSHIPWSEYSQAKWDMRRMLGDLGHDVASSVFTICDYNHKDREINLKGLLRANAEKQVIDIKVAYYAVQNVACVFDDTLTRVKDSTFGTKDMTISAYEYKKPDGRPVFVFWTHADEVTKVKRHSGKAEYEPQFCRPGDSFTMRPVVFRYGGAPLKNPVWVDMLTGRIYAFPPERQIVHSAGLTFVRVPAYDSPCLLTERSVVMP